MIELDLQSIETIVHEIAVNYIDILYSSNTMIPIGVLDLKLETQQDTLNYLATRTCGRVLGHPVSQKIINTLDII